MNGITPPFHPVSSWLAQGICDFSHNVAVGAMGGVWGGEGRWRHKRRISLRFMTYWIMAHPTVGGTECNKLEITSKKGIVSWSRYYSVTIWRDWEKPVRTSVRIACVPVGNRGSYSLTINQNFYDLNHLAHCTSHYSVCLIQHIISVDFVQTSISHKAQLNTIKYYSSNGAPWARPGAMPRGPKWGGANFAPPKKGPRVSCPFFIF